MVFLKELRSITKMNRFSIVATICPKLKLLHDPHCLSTANNTKWYVSSIIYGLFPFCLYHFF